MIYKFSGNHQYGKFEIHLQAPSGLHIERAKRNLTAILEEDGYHIGPLEFDGLMDIAFDSWVIPKDGLDRTIFKAQVKGSERKSQLSQEKAGIRDPNLRRKS